MLIVGKLMALVRQMRHPILNVSITVLFEVFRLSLHICLCRMKMFGFSSYKVFGDGVKLLYPRGKKDNYKNYFQLYLNNVRRISVFCIA